jgi:hypothetical protein
MVPADHLEVIERLSTLTAKAHKAQALSLSKPTSSAVDIAKDDLLACIIAAF